MEIPHVEPGEWLVAESKDYVLVASPLEGGSSWEYGLMRKNETSDALLVESGYLSEKEIQGLVDWYELGPCEQHGTAWVLVYRLSDGRAGSAASSEPSASEPPIGGFRGYDGED